MKEAVLKPKYPCADTNQAVFGVVEEGDDHSQLSNAFCVFKMMRNERNNKWFLAHVQYME